MNILVTGASGFIGSAVVEHPLAAGHQVTGVVRSRTGSDIVASLGATPLRADVAQPHQLARPAAEADGVVHLVFRHGQPMAEAAETDAQVIRTIGAELSGTHRPFVVTSGTLVLPGGRLGAEPDRPDPGGAGGARGVFGRVALGLSEDGVRVSVVRLAPSVHDRERRGFVGALVDADEE